ncbi:MAG TPA: hypothetical protein PLT92_11935 [Ignavibacteriaceae bacterium]|nr:hypothetical protein [Ignavibacteriaceae bacterium]
MKIAIHHTPGSFSDRWIEYCKKTNTSYKIVSAYANDIVEECRDCDIFLWNHLQNRYRDLLFAKSLMVSLEIAGKKVFPDFRTCWHFDDKIGQKYLLESVNAPFVPTYIFFDKKSALEWINETDFPKVFKLSRGASSNNVRLVKSKTKAVRLIKRGFNKGFTQINRWNEWKERYRLFRQLKKPYFWLVKGLIYLVTRSEFDKMQAPEKGYIYFQDFIANNKYDIRVIVIGDKAFAIKRMTRERDFRASGSGKINYDHNEIDTRCVSTAFRINSILKTQCIAYDFVFDAQNNPLIIEISYGFLSGVYDSCEGYWDRDLVWHQGKIFPQYWIIENLISQKD